MHGPWIISFWVVRSKMVNSQRVKGGQRWSFSAYYSSQCRHVKYETRPTSTHSVWREPNSSNRPAGSVVSSLPLSALARRRGNAAKVHLSAGMHTPWVFGACVVRSKSVTSQHGEEGQRESPSRYFCFECRHDK